jgi:hypothetical protein
VNHTHFSFLVLFFFLFSSQTLLYHNVTLSIFHLYDGVSTKRHDEEKSIGRKKNSERKRKIGSHGFFSYVRCFSSPFLSFFLRSCNAIIYGSLHVCDSYLSLSFSTLNMSTTDDTRMMKQWQFTKSGSPRDILTMVEVPIPTTCADDEVLVQVSHVSLNSAIAYRFMAYYGIFDPVGALMGRPSVPEKDFSGIVCDLRGANVKEFKTGNINSFAAMWPTGGPH